MKTLKELMQDLERNRDEILVEQGRMILALYERLDAVERAVRPQILPSPSTVFPPSEDDVRRAYERGIADGRRQELQRVAEWAKECEDANQDAARDAEPGSMDCWRHIGHVHAMQAVARKMKKWLSEELIRRGKEAL